MGRWARPVFGAVIVGVLVQRLGGAPLAGALRHVVGWPVVAAASIAAVTTVCSAWRWRLVAGRLGMDLPLPGAVAAYYRSQLLNATLPGGVVGDVHRAVRHARDGGVGVGAARAVWWERAGGQAVQVLAVTPLLAALLAQGWSRPGQPSGYGGRPLLLVGLATAGVLMACVWWSLRPGRSPVRARLRRCAAAEMRAARVVLGAWPGVVVASVAVFVGHTTTFVLAARVAGSSAPTLRLAQLGAVVLVASALPLNIAGWGPREGASAWVFAATGLGAADGLATAVVYGVLALIGVLPGLGVLAADQARRMRRGAGVGRRSGTAAGVAVVEAPHG
jgi:hypothetical protein